MWKMKRLTRWIVLGIVCLLSPIGLQQAVADAKTDVSITSNKTCDNGSSLYEISNANANSGVIATVTQTVVLSQMTNKSDLQISLAASEKKTLGCSVQDPPPATNAQFTWQVSSAQYK